MQPVLFNIGPLSVHAYGFFLALAFLLGIFISLYYAKREGIRSEIVFDLATYVILASLVGARLFYVIGQWDQYRDNLLEIFMVQKGGLVFLGGMLLVMAVVVWYTRARKINVFKMLDLITPAAAVGYAITRIGCFLNGCCFGIPTHGPCGVVFPKTSLAYSYFPGEPLHPTQLYSALIMFFVFLIILFVYHNKKYDGQVFYWGMVLYSIYRFLVEFIRFSPIHWLWLTPSQWIVLPIFFWAGYSLLVHKK